MSPGRAFAIDGRTFVPYLREIGLCDHERMNLGKHGKIIAALAALILIIRFRTQIAGLLAKVPLVNKLAGVA